MINKITSMDILGKVVYSMRNNKSAEYAKQQVERLTDLIIAELNQYGESPLLSISYNAFTFEENEVFENIQIDHARYSNLYFRNTGGLLIKCFADKVSGGRIGHNMLYDHYFITFGKDGMMPGIDAEMIKGYLSEADGYLPSYYSQNEHRLAQIRREFSEVLVDEEEEAEEILLKANHEASEKKKDADDYYQMRFEEASKRIAALCHEAYEQPMRKTEEMYGELNEIRRVLNETGTKLNSIEKGIHENLIMKIFAGYFDLYRIIGQIGDSAAEENPKLQRNCRSFMDIIEENLMDLSIEPICSAAGDPFNARIHEVVNTKGFDPKTAVVRKSVRHGFYTGDKVWQKEQIEV